MPLPNADAAAIRSSINRHIWTGGALILLLSGGLAVWAARTEVAGAVVSAGMVVPASHAKQIQHPNGGVVRDILVEDGSMVRAGDLLVRLDDTVVRANLAITTKGLDQLHGRLARLMAERDGAAAITFPLELTGRQGEPRIAEIIAAERRLFEFRLASREGQRGQLRERIKQLEDEIAGLAAQSEAKARELALFEQEAEGTRQLRERNLTSSLQLFAVERNVTQAEGALAELSAAIASARGRVAEIQLQIIQIDQDFAAEVAGEMRDVEAQIGELEERLVAEQDQFDHIEIRSPQDGYVHELAVHTLGGVVSPGDVLMQIVPSDQRFAIEARIRPQDVDQLHKGQTARLRFSAFSQRTTPELIGTVDSLSPNVSSDPRTGLSYYTARIVVAPEEKSRLEGAPLMAGMPVEAFVQTGERSFASYITKPFYDLMMRAFRET